MNIKLFLPALAALLLFAGCAAPSSQAPTESSTVPEVSQEPASSSEPAPEAQAGGYRIISMEEAIAMMEEESGYIILDVRTVEEFNERHIPNALNIPNEEIGTEEIPLLPDKDQLILVYCRSGNRSKQASSKLVALGYTNIVEFGGINDWPGEVVSGSQE